MSFDLIPLDDDSRMFHFSTPTVFSILSLLAQFPCIRLKRVIHEKDDCEEFMPANPQITLNMTQATQQMLVHTNAEPKILLKRVRLEQ